MNRISVAGECILDLCNASHAAEWLAGNASKLSKEQRARVQRELASLAEKLALLTIAIS